MRKQCVLLEDHGDSSLSCWQVDQIVFTKPASEYRFTIESYLATIRCHEAGERIERLSLACPGWAKQDEDLCADRQIHLEIEILKFLLDGDNEPLTQLLPLRVLVIVLPARSSRRTDQSPRKAIIVIRSTIRLASS